MGAALGHDVNMYMYVQYQLKQIYSQFTGGYVYIGELQYIFVVYILYLPPEENTCRSMPERGTVEFLWLPHFSPGKTLSPRQRILEWGAGCKAVRDSP